MFKFRWTPRWHKRKHSEDTVLLTISTDYLGTGRQHHSTVTAQPSGAGTLDRQARATSLVLNKLLSVTYVICY